MSCPGCQKPVWSSVPLCHHCGYLLAPYRQVKPTSSLATIVGCSIAAVLLVFYVLAARSEWLGGQRSIAFSTEREILAAGTTWIAANSGRCPTMADLGRSGLRDPWGGEYRMSCASGLQVESNGPDRRANTKDDIFER